jgi:hypothetical protein
VTVLDVSSTVRGTECTMMNEQAQTQGAWV